MATAFDADPAARAILAASASRPTGSGGDRARESLLPSCVAAAFLTADFASRIGLLAAIVAVVGAVLAILRFCLRGRLDKIGWAALAFLTFQALMGIAVGAGPGIHELAAFASYDGRAFVAFVPLVLYATMRTSIRDVERLRSMLRFFVVAGLLLFGLGLAGVLPGVIHRGHFFGLTSSHHVPGLFYGVVAITLGVTPSLRRPNRDRLLAGAAAGLVLASGSRTAVVGVLVAVVYLVLTAPSIRSRVRNVLLAGLGVLLALLLSSRLLNTVQFLTSSDFVGGAATEFSRADTVEGGKQLDVASPGDASLANVLIRFGVWRAGVDEFARSPIVGIGSWRLNDRERTYVGITGVVELATGGEKVHEGGFGAHNLVLQTLAENGLVGLVLFAWPWRLLAKRFSPDGGAHARAGRTLLAYAAGTIVTSNALISPALCFPLLVCCMTLARLPKSGAQLASR